MNRTLAIYFKDGTHITVRPKMSDFGLWDLGSGLSLNIFNGTLYKAKDNVICGEDITDTVKMIDVSILY